MKAFEIIRESNLSVFVHHFCVAKEGFEKRVIMREICEEGQEEGIFSREANSARLPNIVPHTYSDIFTNIDRCNSCLLFFFLFLAANFDDFNIFIIVILVSLRLI